MVIFYHVVMGVFLDGTPSTIQSFDNANPLKLLVVDGHSGVSLFMVLSGFIFTWGALSKDAFNFKGFFRNRLLRIAPLFLFVLFIGASIEKGAFTLDVFLQNLFVVNNLGGRIGGDFSVVLWTIAVEVQFYLMFPFLLHMLKNHGASYIIGLLVLVNALRFIAYGGGSLASGLAIDDVIYWTIFGRIDYFLMGMLLAYWYRHDFSALTNLQWFRKLSVLFLGIVCVLSALWIYHNVMGDRFGFEQLKLFWPLLESAAWAVFVLGYLLSASYLPTYVAAGLVLLGEISYSLYLLHWPIMKALISADIWIRTSLPPFYEGILNTILVALPIMIVICSLSYRVVEKPFLTMRKAYMKPSPDRATETV